MLEVILLIAAVAIGITLVMRMDVTPRAADKPAPARPKAEASAPTPRKAGAPATSPVPSKTPTTRTGDPVSAAENTVAA